MWWWYYCHDRSINRRRIKPWIDLYVIWGHKYKWWRHNYKIAFLNYFVIMTSSPMSVLPNVISIDSGFNSTSIDMYHMMMTSSFWLLPVLTWPEKHKNFFSSTFLKLRVASFDTELNSLSENLTLSCWGDSGHVEKLKIKRKTSKKGWNKISRNFLNFFPESATSIT